jgi:hypothetical protein
MSTAGEICVTDNAIADFPGAHVHLVVMEHDDTIVFEDFEEVEHGCWSGYITRSGSKWYTLLETVQFWYLFEIVLQSGIVERGV